MPLQDQQTTTTKLEGRLNRLLKYNEDQKKIKSCPYASPRESFVWWGDVSMFVSAWLTSNVCQDNADQQDEARRSDDTLALSANMRRGRGGDGRGTETETNKIENSRKRGTLHSIIYPVMSSPGRVMSSFVVLQLHCISVILHFSRLDLAFKSFLWPAREEEWRQGLVVFSHSVITL